MKVRNKGKVYPSPSSSSSSSSPSLPSSSPNNDDLSVLKLLPAAILALASVLSLQDRQVLAYMITRSMRSTNPSSSLFENKKKNNKSNNIHKPPVFDCECFDCYTTYWFRWDSSPNRELIHQAIEAFEEHLNNGEISRKSSSSSRGKKREKVGRRANVKSVNLPEAASPEREADVPEIDDIFVHVSPGNNITPVPEKPEGISDKVGDQEPEEVESPDTAVVVRGTAASNDKGLARKVLPDVLGLFSSRLWSLWSPNM